MQISHGDLVKRAQRWLIGTARCNLALIHRQPWSCKEHPDAIGWLPDGRCIVVECKMSPADWRADRYKAFRRAGQAPMGMYRYYLTPKGVITHNGWTPEGHGWIELCGSRVFKRVAAPVNLERNTQAEMALLVAAWNDPRINLAGQKISPYTYKAGEGLVRDEPAEQD